MPHLLPALSLDVGGQGRALGWWHFLGLRPTFSPSPSHPRMETGPTVQQNPSYCKEKEKVRCQRGLGQAGWGKQDGGWLLGRGRLSEEWSEPFPHYPCVAL